MHFSTILELATFGLAAVATALPTTADVSAANSPKEMAKDPNGFISFDKDGVLRSFDGNNQVIGYYPLNPTQISNMIAALPGDYDKTAMTEQFAGVDGTKVTDKTQLLTPAADITSGAADVSVNKRAEVKARLEDSHEKKDVCMHPSCGRHSGCPGECDLGCIHAPTNNYAGRYCGSSD